MALVDKGNLLVLKLNDNRLINNYALLIKVRLRTLVACRVMIRGELLLLEIKVWVRELGCLLRRFLVVTHWIFSSRLVTYVYPFRPFGISSSRTSHE